jgi:diketogulonate reductase-like aldo/keto reductase
MTEFVAQPGGGKAAVNQLLYNLTRRGIEWDLLPWCEKRKLPVMAYSPVEQARLLRDRPLALLAASLAVTPAQLALAWVLRRDGVIAIPKAASATHVEENARAGEIVLSPETLAELDRLYPAPGGAEPLEML